MIIGIKEIASYIPAKFESNFSKKADFEIGDDFIRKECSWG